MAIKAICGYCNASFEIATGHFNRAKAFGRRVFCNRACAGLSRRRLNKPSREEKRGLKAEYDKKRREILGEELRAKKRAAYYADHEAYKAKHAVYRKKRMPKHVEYCRQPEYVKWKSEYDRHYRAKKMFGEFSEAFLVLQDIENELDKQMSPHDRRLANGTYNKSLRRKRALCLPNLQQQP